MICFVIQAIGIKGQTNFILFSAALSFDR